MSESSSKPLTVTFNEIKELYRSYMPLIKGGGLFIPTTDDIYKISNKVFVIIKIKDEKTQTLVTKTFSGIVVWLTTSGAHQGIGVAFENALAIKDYIETIISTTPGKNDLLSYTI